MKSQNNIHEADAIIVLANEMSEIGILNSESKARAEFAVSIFNENSIPIMVACGWNYRPDTKIKIADAIKAYVVEVLQVDPQKVFTESASRDTVGDAFFTKRNLALPLGWRRLLVVTSKYHARRTEEIFNFIYGDNFKINVTGVDVNANELTLRKEVFSLSAFRKTFFGIKAGQDKQIFQRLIQEHPYYNGVIYDKVRDL